MCARAQMYASLSPKAPSTALPLPRDGRDLAHLEVLYAYIPTAAYTPGDTSHANHRHSLFEHERVVPLRDAPPCMRVSNDDSRQACAQAGGGGAVGGLYRIRIIRNWKKSRLALLHMEKKNG